MGKYTALSKALIAHVGGRRNIAGISHCITRLRFRLKDDRRANESAIRDTDGVVTILKSVGQLQVVIGNHVAEVYDEVCALTGYEPDAEDAMLDGAMFDRLIDMIYGCFSPFLSVFVAMGIVKGLNELLVFLELYTEVSGTYQILNAIGDSPFRFLPIILGFTAGKKLRLNPYVGMIIGAALCYVTEIPAAAASIFGLEYSLTFLGIPWVINDYRSTVVPVIMIVWFASKIQRWAKDFVPDLLQTFCVPFLTLMISLPIGFLVIGPVVTVLANLLTSFFQSLYAFSPLLMGAIVGAVWQVLVIFGLHWSLVTLAIINLTTTGFDMLLVGSFCCSFAQTACVLAMYVKTKDKKLRELCLPAIISGLCGVTEPAIYGITLPQKKPFYFSMVGSMVGGMLMCGMGTSAYVLGGLGLFGFVNYINPYTNDASGVINALFCVTVSMLIGFLLTFFFWTDAKKTKETAPVLINPLADMVEIFSPLQGGVCLLTANQEERLLGKGVAITPSQGAVYAPFDGTVEAILDDCRGICLRSKAGVELLLHFGPAMAENKPALRVKAGDPVFIGQQLLRFQLPVEPFIVHVIVTNSDQYLEVLETIKEQVTPQDRLLTALK